jgi:hypothetical protein
MKTKNYGSKLLTYWLFYNLIFVCVCYFFQLKTINIIVQINSSLFFILGFISAFIARRDQYSKAIFIHFAILFYLYSLVITPMTIVENNYFNNSKLNQLIITIKFILFYFTFLYSILYVIFNYILNFHKKTLTHLFSVALTSMVIICCFWPSLTQFYNPEVLPTALVNHEILTINLIGIIYIVTYAIIFHKKDRPYTEYMNLIIGGFFIFMVINIIENLHSDNTWLNSIFIQYLLFLNNLYFIIILMQRLVYIHSPFADFYESFLRGQCLTNYNIKIKCRGLKHMHYLRLINDYLHYKKNRITITGLFILLALSLSNVPLVLKINLLVVAFCLATILVYSLLLYQKRLKNGNLLN